VWRIYRHSPKERGVMHDIDECAFFAIASVTAETWIAIMSTRIDPTLARVQSRTGAFQIIASKPFEKPCGAILQKLEWQSLLKCECVAEVVWRPIQDPLQICL
jgi:hypothetical protein